jgi:hypothetical protein
LYGRYGIGAPGGGGGGVPYGTCEGARGSGSDEGCVAQPSTVFRSFVMASTSQQPASHAPSRRYATIYYRSHHATACVIAQRRGRAPAP